MNESRYADPRHARLWDDVCLYIEQDFEHRLEVIIDAFLAAKNEQFDIFLEKIGISSDCCIQTILTPQEFYSYFVGLDTTEFLLEDIKALIIEKCPESEKDSVMEMVSLKMPNFKLLIDDEKSSKKESEEKRGLTLSENEYFKPKKRPLGVRVDLAWNALKNETPNEDEKRDARQFLAFVFRLDETSKNLMKQIKSRMDEREKYRLKNQYHVPEQAPEWLDECGISPDLRTNYRSVYVREAINDGVVLEVSENSKIKDKNTGATYLTPEQQANRELLIGNDGKLYRKGKLFDSSKFTSHGKKGFVSFTMDFNGNISIFNHLNGQEDKKKRILYHSSMTKGNPTLIAGELKVDDGKVKLVTTYSGHYCPSLANIALFFKHLKSKDVSLAGVKAITQDEVPENVSKNCKKLDERAYETPAYDIMCNVERLFEETNKELDNYKKGDLVSKILRIINHRFTVERRNLAVQFNDDKKEILGSCDLSPSEKIEKMKRLTDDYIEKNNACAALHGGKKDSGKLNQVFCLFNDKINKLEKGIIETPDDVVTALMNTH